MLTKTMAVTRRAILPCIALALVHFGARSKRHRGFAPPELRYLVERCRDRSVGAFRRHESNGSFAHSRHSPGIGSRRDQRCEPTGSSRTRRACYALRVRPRMPQSPPPHVKFCWPCCRIARTS